MWLGVDYYPEQWDISMIDKDLDNIIELGSNVIRIGEFAWHIMEKEEIVESTEINIKYKGYIEREKLAADKLRRLDNIRLPKDFDYNSVQSLSTEARQKLRQRS